MCYLSDVNYRGFAVNIENFAIHKFPRTGKCKNSCFLNGNHRVGIVPVASILDGGASGDSCREICLECGKIFNQPRWFVLIKQPNAFLKERDDEIFYYWFICRFICNASRLSL